MRAVNRKNENKLKYQQLLTNKPEKFMFVKDVCKTLLLANISLEKLEINISVSFFGKYTCKAILFVLLLRKSYIVECYEDTMNEIRKYFQNKNWRKDFNKQYFTRPFKQ